MASTKSIEYFLQGAEDAYWFSMEEGGNAEALRNGLELLNEVENFDDFSSDTGLQERVNALKVDLDKQLELTHDTLFGVFPVVRFATDSLMANSGSLGTYEILDDPSVMAATSAVDRLREVLAQTIELYGQLDVFLVSNPRNHDLENEAIFMLNKDPNFFVHSRANMVSILGKKNLDELYSKVSKAEGKLDNFFDAHAMKMRSNFRNNQVLMVNIRKTRNSFQYRLVKNKITEVTYRDLGTSKFSGYISWAEQGVEADSGDALYAASNQTLAIGALSPSSSNVTIYDNGAITETAVGSSVAGYQIALPGIIDQAVTGSTGDSFPFTGSAEITGSLGVTGSSEFLINSSENFIIKNASSPTQSLFNVNQDGVAVFRAREGVDGVPTAIVGGLYFTTSSAFIGID